ncbi:Pls/PosA family non-ribosomal peptide synthetase [Enterovirga rhinocerotis]|uniref:Non-ribosomal peptide synthetase-like protein n=1 Tax=Enterovirga rhinocerotis TaxID=1339210 RepID=A0A4R7C7E3_9HYPH|nr:Pls/PosA family non-ribosomal peptide synthetase [Enterovirga rhinocerotis]TDR94308.1 non-ribosomal peptide synthetase-like protein [Enterovirga rhinocerotis]
MRVASDALRPGAEGGRRDAAVLLGDIRPDLVRDEVLSEIFAASVAGRGDHPAMVFGEQRLTYRDVDAKADAIARGLLRLGIGPGMVVGLWMERGADLLIAQIAITKTGAAWLPFDADAPADRIAVCLDDAEAKGLLTSASLSGRAPTNVPILTAAQLVDDADTRAVPARPAGVTPDHPAYLIYTSGSTGVPKGIVISQRNICHFLRSANELYGFTQDDIVFQGASVAFDLSMEEIWIPLMVGATLHVATPAMIGDVENLPGLLDAAGVTVLDTVPTLLAMISREVPSLRLILMGGEALPAPLVNRWAKPGCRLFNTYGPTEATVVATACEALPGQPVTIGRPIANYTAYVVDESGRLCGPGEQGELWIGGPGVATGYLKRPELTAEKFVDNPFGGDGRDPILYRSGDAVALTPEGELAFHGRIDDQVKIRGFRVELGEIETRVSDLAGIGQAAVVMRQDDGLDRLVAFIVPERGAEAVATQMRAALRRDLPPYMVPDHFETVGELPRLSSGKVDRKALRAAPLSFGDAPGEQDEPASETEAALLVAAKRAFGNQTIPFEADFFAELGGHSLIAARFVGAVRETPALASITLQDVYTHRTLRAMAEDLVRRTGGVGAETAIRDMSFEPPPLRRRFLCGLAQAVAMPFLVALTTTQWLGVFLTYLIIAGEGLEWWAEILGIFAVYVMINIVTGAIAIAAKWLILGRTKPGRYPLWGSYYFRWWLVTRLLTLIHIKWLQGSPAIAIYLRLLGAKIGRDAVIADLHCGAPDLLTVGAGTVVGSKVCLHNVEIVGNELVIAPIHVGADVLIGTSCVVSPGAVIHDGAELADLTTVPEGAVVQAGERWDGSPGRKVGMVDLAALPPQAEATRGRRIFLGCIYAAMLIVMPAVSLLPIFPAFFIFERIDDWISATFEVSYFWYLPLITWPTAIALTALTVLLIALVRWAVLPTLRSGRFSIFSGFYMRKWIVSLGTEVTLETLSSLFATVFMRAWYRLMGAKIGRGAEISTNLSGRYDIVGIGAGNFVADEVVFGDEDVRRGYMYLEPVETGSKVFVGNDAVVPPGTKIPDNVLIGIKSKPPANDMMAEGDTWFGSPPIKLPTRQKIDAGGAATYEPSLRMKLARLGFETLHTSFPGMLFISFGITAVDTLFYPAVLRGDWGWLAVSFILASVAIAVAQTLVVVGVKWALMGRYQPLMKPMWSWWAMRTEAVAVLYWGLAGKVLLEHTQGTPFLPWILRLFGTKTGKGICMISTDITEFDCVKIGDFCVINELAALQTHLYEDRVMKVGRVELGNGVTVGSNATVLYDSKVGDFAVLRPLTVIMKGESIPANSEWEGAPAVPVLHEPEPQKLAA